MERPEHVSEAVWEKHLDWFNVTGETSRRHLRELREGALGRRYQGQSSPAETDKAETSPGGESGKRAVETED